jgi:hypothetical protein
MNTENPHAKQPNNGPTYSLSPLSGDVRRKHTITHTSPMNEERKEADCRIFKQTRKRVENGDWRRDLELSRRTGRRWTGV